MQDGSEGECMLACQCTVCQWDEYLVCGSEWSVRCVCVCVWEGGLQCNVNRCHLRQQVHICLVR